MEARPQIALDRLSLLLGGAAISFTLGRVVQLPARQVGWQVLGSPLGLTLSTSWWMLVFVVALVVAGAQALYLAHPRGRRLLDSLPYLIMPALTALAVGLVLDQVEQVQLWIPLMLSGVVVLGLVSWVEYGALDATGRRARERLLSTSLIYALVWGLSILICVAQLRSLLAGPAAAAVAFLLSFRLLWETGQALRRLLVYAGAAGLAIGQLTWVLNYWQLQPLVAGLLLLVAFYLLTGLAQAALWGQLDRRALIEHGVMALMAGAAVAILSS